MDPSEQKARRARHGESFLGTKGCDPSVIAAPIADELVYCAAPPVCESFLMMEQRKTSEKRTRPLGSAPVGMEWDDSASIDDFIVAKHRALTMPAQHKSSRTDFAAAGIQTGAACTSMPASGEEDRLTVNWAEWRKGYSYSVEVDVDVPQSEMRGGLLRSSDTEMRAPRELLDQSGSNDFSAYKEIQELKGACAMLSPKLGSSPFAKQTQQPFADNASCRSRLSDYGFTSDSGDEQDWDCCYGDDMESPVKEQLPPLDFGGFWAEVGAVGSSVSPSISHDVSCDTEYRLFQTPTPTKDTPATPQVVWEVNEWDSPCDDSSPDPQQRPCQQPQHQQHQQQQALSESPERPSPKRQAVLLPWDMM